jgi:hypothetical protein
MLVWLITAWRPQPRKTNKQATLQKHNEASDKQSPTTKISWEVRLIQSDVFVFVLVQMNYACLVHHCLDFPYKS